MTLQETIEETLHNLDIARGEVTLDFSSVRRISSGDLAALEKLDAEAAAKSVKLLIRHVDVSVYKVLKLARLRCA